MTKNINAYFKKRIADRLLRIAQLGFHSLSLG